MSNSSYSNNQACTDMWRNSNPSNQACVEMWRNAVPNRPHGTNSQETAQRPPSALSDSDDMCAPSALSDSDVPPPSALSDSDDMRPPSALSSSDAPPPSALSDSDDMRPPSALGNSDAPPPSALSDDDDSRLPSLLSSDVGSLRLAVSSMSPTRARHQGTVDYRHSRQDGGYHARAPCSRASPSSTLAENGYAVCLASERAVQWVIERERVQNNRVQVAVEEAEASLAELLRLVARVSGVGLQEVQEKVSDSMAEEMEASLATSGHVRVCFTVENHPEDRDPMRPGTPRPLQVLSDGYYADDEKERPEAPTRRKTQRSGRPSRPAPPPSTPELLQRPVYILRALDPSEVWDEDSPAEPILYAPLPLRPLREPELLLAGYNSTTDSGKYEE